METHVALAADGHAEGAVAEHLNADELARGAADMLLTDLTVDICHLIHIQFTGEHHDIGKLGVEAQGLDVGDVELCREMHLLPYPITIGHHSHVGGNHSRDVSGLGCIDNLMHQGDILAVDDGIDGEVALDAMLTTSLGDLLQVVDGERRGRMGTHVQFLDTKVDAVGTCLYGCRQRLAGAYWRHDLIFRIHNQD